MNNNRLEEKRNGGKKKELLYYIKNQAIRDIKKQEPSIFSVEAPFRLLRNLNGTGESAAEKVPLQKIEDLIAKSINFTNKYIY